MNNWRRAGNSRRQSGLALVEVLAAILILAIALPALLFYVDGVSRETSNLQDKTVAQWIASNQLTELEIRRRLSGTQLKGESNGEVEMNHRRWSWRAVSKSTPVDGIRQIEMSVFPPRLAGVDEPPEETPLVTLMGVVEQ